MDWFIYLFFPPQLSGLIVLLLYSFLVIIVVSITCWWNAEELEELSQEEDHL